MLLDKINNANDIKNIDPADYAKLAKEIRGFLVRKVGANGGHLASNLGVVELTMALHLALDIDKDKIIWDVGHQSYVHKILTGRKKGFDTLRQEGGLSGFPKRRESDYDVYNTGHSSTSIPAAIGYAQAAQLKGEDSTIVAVTGDGSLTGGLAFEGLNNLAKLDRNLIIILNDNNRSISENVGGMSTYLSKLRAGEGYNDLKAGVVKTLQKIPKVGDRMVKNIKKTKSSIKTLFVSGMIFENMGITYLGPIDGHNILLMKRMIEEAKKLDHPVVIHVVTKKGRGYKPAEDDPALFHGIGAFDTKTGIPTASPSLSYTKVFSEALLEEAEKNPKIVAITAAMADGTGLTSFMEKYPDRFFDVGIAEEFAAVFAAGLASGGMKPFIAVYSSFLQRAYDEVMMDVCMQNLPVTFCVDRAGLVGNDGETHQGVFDLTYLGSIPNMSIIAPKNDKELKEAVRFAATYKAPLAIRYPRGAACTDFAEFDEPFVYGKSEIMYSEKDIAIIAVGNMVKEAVKVRDTLKEKGHNVTLVNARFVKPIDEEMIAGLLDKHKLIVTMEENVLAGGYGMNVMRTVNIVNPAVKVLPCAVPNEYIEQGTQKEQLHRCRLDAESVVARIEEELGL